MSNNRHINEDELGYRLALYGKHLEITDPIKDYVIEKLARIEKLSDRIIEVNVRIEVQKLVHHVEIDMLISQMKIWAHADTDNMYSAIDKAFDRLQRKVRKWKSRIQQYHAKKPVMIDVPVNVYNLSEDEEVSDYNAEIEAQNAEQLEKELIALESVQPETIPLKTLRPDEALMKLTLSGDAFMVYKDEEHQDLRVVFRRPDGSLGIIAPVA